MQKDQEVEMLKLKQQLAEAEKKLLQQKVISFAAVLYIYIYIIYIYVCVCVCVSRHRPRYDNVTKNPGMMTLRVCLIPNCYTAPRIPLYIRYKTGLYYDIKEGSTIAGFVALYNMLSRYTYDGTKPATITSITMLL